MVGAHSTSQMLGEGTLYIQLHRDPDDLEAFETSKAEILRLKPADWQSEWVIVPAKYSYPELWKWGVILDRFAGSQGNTIGILSAAVMNNGRAAAQPAEFAIYPEAGPGRAWAEDLTDDDASLKRTTILIRSLDPYVVQDALPVLLPQLGIPVNAVGVILKDRKKCLHGARAPCRHFFQYWR